MDQAALAGASRADNGVSFAGFSSEGDFPYGRFTLLVLETYFFKHDLAAAERKMSFSALEPLRFVQNLRDAFGAGAGVLNDIRELSDRTHAVTDREEVKDHFNKVAQENLLSNDLQTADPKDER